MSDNFESEMDSLCEAFAKLTIRDMFNAFSRLPDELKLMIWKEAIAAPVVHDIEIPEVLLGINRLSHDEAKKVYKRLTRLNSRAIFFNTQQDSVLLRDSINLYTASLFTEKTVVNSVQSSARICDVRPPLIDIDRYLELDPGDWLAFPFCHLQTFVVQDLQCSRNHRLQDITEQMLCKARLRRFFVKQNRKYRRIMVPEIIIRDPPPGEELCYECEVLDEWLAMDHASRNLAIVSIIEGNQET
ncbi:hypothetical protein BOTNAR_0024g00170 [Botryotinia narcissicola]|uniref:2EXR domain-containing protein n=1 Tax=Botryotinia narcissicola TaxID=278944 RepID=A0A4Z1J4D6_9HELO|nr:hypothetical protein BOTNAR_0024g00170 [Botryotinia narcissicola]